MNKNAIAYAPQPAFHRRRAPLCETAHAACITLKQVEAFYWSGTLGSFEAGAQKLNITQSTVSKRIQEFEAQSKVELFDRTGRAVRLTTKGQELLQQAEEMLGLRNEFMLKLRSSEAYSGRFCIGVTELIALTWLPRLVGRIKAKYPNLSLTLRVDTALNMHEGLSDHQVDLVLAPPGRISPVFERVALTKVECAWMASPSLGVRSKLALHEIAHYPLLTESDSSGMQVMVEQLLRESGAKAANVMSCNSLGALGDLAAAGLGIACLPRTYFESKLLSGALRLIESDPPIPRLTYVATFREDATKLSADIAAIAAEVCSSDSRRWVPRSLGPALDDDGPSRFTAMTACA